MRYGVALGALLMLLMSTGQAEAIVSAAYEGPVERYGHFALGRPHEYARVVARTDAGRSVGLALQDDEVFEDLSPRLVR
ncbi:MAG: VCBS repeat-containing protein, partial [bacterium]|nr:VCBS repeat-containing protein [bacterium]